MSKEISLAEAPGLLKPGMKVFVQGALGFPEAIFQSLAARPEAARGVHFSAALVPSVNSFDPAGLHDEARLTTFFIFGDVATSYAAGKVRFMPLHYSGMSECLIENGPYDLAIIQVSEADGEGRHSFGPSMDFASTLLPHCRQVLAEVNPQFPATPGSPTILGTDIDYRVSVDHALPELATDNIPPTLDAIADNVASLVRDGDCLQVGIGKLPGAILSRLTDKKDLGLQGGMITNEAMQLIRAGAMTGARKTIDKDRHICGIAVGTRELYDWVAGREDVMFKPATYTHDPAIISRLDNFVSINSVLEVDLTGQGNAEMINGRQVSGTGGLVDFIRAARMSRGGRSILALSATAAKGTLSRIVPKLDRNVVVSALRADVDYVVSEFGIAQLRHKSLDERAEALTAIAAPEFRKELSQAWDEIAPRVRP